IDSGKKVVTKNKPLTLTIAKVKTVKPKTVKVRDLTGYNLKSIQDYATEVHLRLDTSYAYSSDIEEGLLVSQSPEANTTINQGETLSVVISKGPDPEKTTDSDSESSNSNTNSNTTKTVTKDITIPYDANGDNSITIYISDSTHSINSPYRTMTISEDTPVTLSFNLKDGQTGSYIVERNNKTVLGGSVNR
ncbi:MAG TPA: PASTA domain-containing protein, partial [Companilactobacillus farciminis]|nr:PASTA domain-containing protein [Companilactobacillus farciminis]